MEYLTKQQRIERDNKIKYALIPVDRIKDNPYQTRKKYPNIKSLARNISRHGLINPVTVVDVNHGSEYVLLSGHRRLRAYRSLKRETIPATIRDKVTKDELALILAIENARRKDFTPAEKALAIFNALNESIPNIRNDYLRSLTVINQLRLFEKRDKVGINFQNELGFEKNDVFRCRKILDSLDISANTAISYIRLFDLPDSILKNIIQSDNGNVKRYKKITVKAAYELTRIKNDDLRIEIYNEYCSQHIPYINLKFIIDNILEQGEEGFAKLGRNKKRNDHDYVLLNLIEKNFHHASVLWNWRQNKLRITKNAMDKTMFNASLIRLRKSSFYLIEAINRILDLNDDQTKIKLINKTLTVKIKPGTGGQKYRFSFPSKYGEELGLEFDDELYLNITAIKKNRVKKS